MHLSTCQEKLKISIARRSQSHCWVTKKFTHDLDTLLKVKYLTGVELVCMTDICVSFMSGKTKILLTNKLNNVPLSPHPSVGQRAIVSVQDVHVGHVASADADKNQRDRHQSVGRVDQNPFGLIHV